MPQSLAKIDVHLIFSTKNRERLIPGHIRPALHAYRSDILRDLSSTAVEINSEPAPVISCFSPPAPRRSAMSCASSKRLQSRAVAAISCHQSQSGFGRC
jgi:hypothetical protein